MENESMTYLVITRNRNALVCVLNLHDGKINWLLIDHHVMWEEVQVRLFFFFSSTSFT